ncbi:MAG: PEP-utilizing enzyme [Patescibacteria group bacterium]
MSRMWVKYVTRRIAVQTSQAWNYGFGTAMKKKYGAGIPDTLVFRDRKKSEYYVDSIQLGTYTRRLIKLLRQKQFLDSFHGEAVRVLCSILKKVQVAARQDLTSKSNQELLKIYERKIWPFIKIFFVRMWAVHSIGEPLAHAVREELRKVLSNEAVVTRNILLFSQPLTPNEVIQERIALLRLAEQRKRWNKKKVQQKLRAHARRYRHIPVFDFDHTPYAFEHFIGEFNALRRPGQQRRALEGHVVTQKKLYAKALQHLPLTGYGKKLIAFLKEDIWLRDYRDSLRQKLNMALQPLYDEIGHRLGLTLDEVALLSDHEIDEYLRAGTLFPKKVIRQRQSAFLLIHHGNQVKLLSGKSAIQQAKVVIQQKLHKTYTVQGATGSTGHARGRVTLVFTNRDLHKVRTGDILVAPMTRQDFVPAMRKAAATITDEGGITCHAAIVSREMRKPCVVGTKHATQIFKDGDRVEVDADKGIVRKI